MRVSHSSVEIWLASTAVIAVLLGSAVYLLDRNWVNSLFLHPFADYQWARFAVFGAFGGFLPALLHAYAVCMLLMIVLRPWPRARSLTCLLWFAIASFLECLQSDTGSKWFVSSEADMSQSMLMASLSSYTLHGTFDILDLIATGMGCIAALVLVTSSIPHRRRNKA